MPYVTNIMVKADDWYSLTMSDLKENGFPSKITRLQLVNILNTKYPNHDWERAYPLRGRFAQQRRLEKAVAVLFQVTLYERIG